LRDFYSAQVESVAKESPTPERQIRRWIGDALVSQTGVRLTVLREPDSTAGLDNAMVNALIDARLLREDWAGGRAWVELSHDRLVGPVMSDNESWFAAHLHPLQRGAVAWEPTRSDSLLLRGSDYMDAVRWVEETKPELLPVEREYLAASEELAEQERRDRRRRMVIFALLLIALVAAFLAWQNGQNARRQEELAISRQLSVEATAENTREDVGLLLALEAYRFDESLASAGAVMSTLEEHPHVVRFLHGHKAPVVSIEFSPDGTLLAAGGENHEIWIFDVASGSPVEGAPLKGHQSPVFGLAFSPDGSVLASSDDTGRVRLWDVRSLTPLGDEWEVGDGPVRALDFHPTEANLLATGDPDGSISIRDIRDLGSGPVRTMQGHDPGDGESVIVRSIDFSPDGSLLASGGNDGQVRLWDTVTGDQIGDPGGDHEAIVRAVVFNPSPDRRTIASAGNDEMVILWSWDDETGLSRALGVDGADLPKMEGHTERIYALAYAPDGNLLASASRDGTVLLWDTSTGTRHLDQNREQTSPLSAHSGAVIDLAFSSLPSAAGPVLATASNDRTVIISEPLRPNRLGVRLATGSTKLLALAQHPEQPYFVSVVGEASLQTWDAATLQGVGEPMTGFIGTVRSMAYDDAGTQLASGGDDCTVHVWSPETGRRIAQLLGHTRSVTSIAFAAEADQLISVAQDGKVLLWDVASGVSEVLMGRTESGGTIHVCGPDSSGVEGLATYDSSNSTSRPASAWFTPDGAWLVVAWNDGSYRVWPWENGRPGDMSEISEFDITAMPRHLGDEGMAVALEGDEILVWSRLDGWAPLDAPPEPDLRIVSATATGVALGPLGSLVSGGGDGMFRVWDLASGGLVGEPVATGAPVVSVIGFETPSTLITLGQSDNLIVWDIDVEEWTSRICPIANKNLEDEWKQYIPSRPYRDTCPTATS
jgi:WD40 repeat protein